MEIRIKAKSDGMLLRKFLQDELELSNKLIRHIKFLPNGIRVNGQPVTVRCVLHENDRLSLATEDTETAPIEPVELPIEILYEDDELTVPSKPAEMPTHPSHGHYRDTVANALAYRDAKEGAPFIFRPINRLDRNTSGLLLVARNRHAAGKLTQAMQSGRIHKTYLAVLDGEMQSQEGVIDACLHRTAKSIIVREVCPPETPDAAPSRTAFRVLAVGGGHTLVEARPLTGRTHQLRVHFAYIGHPITGDDLYGSPSSKIPRHALHARTLRFPHPLTDCELCLRSPLPPDMRHLIEIWFPTLTERNLP